MNCGIIPAPLLLVRKRDDFFGQVRQARRATGSGGEKVRLSTWFAVGAPPPAPAVERRVAGAQQGRKKSCQKERRIVLQIEPARGLVPPFWGEIARGSLNSGKSKATPEWKLAQSATVSGGASARDARLLGKTATGDGVFPCICSLRKNVQFNVPGVLNPYKRSRESCTKGRGGECHNTLFCTISSRLKDFVLLKNEFIPSSHHMPPKFQLPGRGVASTDTTANTPPRERAAGRLITRISANGGATAPVDVEVPPAVRARAIPLYGVDRRTPSGVE